MTRGVLTLAALLLLPAATGGSAEVDPPPAVIDHPPVEELLTRPFLDDHLANVVYGFRIVTQTGRYAGRYAGNDLTCANCHLDAGRRTDALPLNVAGLYPKWRGKNGRMNGIGLRIRECFVYSMDGIMPPEHAPEVMAVAAYISYLSDGQTVGRSPPGRGAPTLPDTGLDPNPSRGAVVYASHCQACHGDDGAGGETAPPLWGVLSYNRGAGMNNTDKAAGFIWANMPLGQERTLSHQQAQDVAAFLHLQYRPADPRHDTLIKMVEPLVKGAHRLVRRVVALASS